MTARKFTKGFTLIELLVVIGILAILLAITLIAINPARQFGQSNDTKRRSDLTAILNAIGQYAASNSGNLPADIVAHVTAGDFITGTPPNTTPVFLPLNSTNFATLCADLVPDYLPAIPVDPSGNDQNGIEEGDCGGAWATGTTSVYEMTVDANNRVTLSASAPYAGPIQVTR
jgi:type IV pilus assembly protein PilA